MPELASETKPLLSVENVAKLIALIVALAYACGFLILSLHLSRFGVTDFGLAEPRIVFSGFLFMLLVSLPCLAVSRVFALFGLSRSIGIKLPSTKENEAYINTVLVGGFVGVAYLLSVLSSFLFDFGSEHHHTAETNALWYSIWLVIPISGFAIRRSIHEHPKKCVALSFLSAGVLMIALWQFDHRPRFWITLWYYLIGLSFVFLLNVWRDPQTRHRIEWEHLFLSFLALLVPFTSGIYGNVRPEFGGGGPLRATLYLSGKVPLAQTACINAVIIDQNSNGFYLRREAEIREAMFIKRDLVTAIKFVREADPSCH